MTLTITDTPFSIQKTEISFGEFVELLEDWQFGNMMASCQDDAIVSRDDVMQALLS